MKKVKKTLYTWSREIFGDIFKEIAMLEDTIKVMELQFEDNPNGENRELLHGAQAKLN